MLSHAFASREKTLLNSICQNFSLSFKLHRYRRTSERQHVKRVIFKRTSPVLVLPAAIKLQVIVTTTGHSFLFLDCQSTELKVYYRKINLFIMKSSGNHKLNHKCETHVV